MLARSKHYSLRCSIILVLFFVQISFAQTNGQMKQLGKKMTFFYQHPKKSNFEYVQRNIVAMLKNKKDKRLLALLVWVDKVSQTHGWKINENFYPEAMKKLRNPQSELGQFVSDDRIINPTKLDVWWSSFFATGESRYVKKIFNQAQKLEITKETLGAKTTKTNQDVHNFLTSAAATWSFKSNCRQHQKIREFARKWQQQANLTQDAKKLLKICIDGVASKK